MLQLDEAAEHAHQGDEDSLQQREADGEQGDRCEREQGNKRR